MDTRQILRTTMLTLALMQATTPAKSQEDFGTAKPYAVIDLGNLRYQWIATAFGVNNAGVVVGESVYSTDGYHAMMWKRGNMIDIMPDFEGDSSAYAINDHEQVVGRAWFEGGLRAFYWNEGQLQDLGTLGGAWSEAWDINNVGQIIGEAEYSLEHKRNWPFLWESGNMRSLLPPCDDCSGSANGINDSGQIVGSATLPELNLSQQPIRWEPDGSMTVLYDSRGIAWDINNHGQVAGNTGFGSNSTRAVLWEADGTQVELGGGVAYAINDAGFLIGGDGSNGPNASVIWDLDRKPHKLGHLIAPLNKWKIDTVWDINNHNQMAARGSLMPSSLKDYAFLLTPITPKFAITEPAPAVAGEMNEITAHGGALEPGMKVNFYWSTHGGGTMFPSSSCDILDAVLQLENAKWAGSAIADANGIATLIGTVPISAKDRYVLFQAVVPASETGDNKCMQSPFSVVQFN